MNSYLPSNLSLFPFNKRYKSTEFDLDSCTVYDNLDDSFASLFDAFHPFHQESSDSSFPDDSIFACEVHPSCEERVYVESDEYYNSYFFESPSSQGVPPSCGSVENLTSRTNVAVDECLDSSNLTSANVLAFFRQLCLLRSMFLAFCAIKLDMVGFTRLVEHAAKLDDEKPYLVGIEPNPGPSGRKNGNKTKTKPKNRARPRKARPPNKSGETSMILRPLPPTQTVQKVSDVCNLTFQLGSTVFNNPGGSIITEPFYTNDGYDILPSILTPAMQFINYKFSLYRYCKVLSVRFIITFDNLEQSPMDLYFFSSAQNLASTFPTRAALNAMTATRKLLWTDILSEQCGKKSQVTMDKVVYPWMALGNKLEYNSSNDFSFTQSSNPVRLTYGAWVISSPFSIIPTGIAVRTSLNFTLKFYDPLDIQSPLLDPVPVPTPCPQSHCVPDKGKYIRKA